MKSSLLLVWSALAFAPLSTQALAQNDTGSVLGCNHKYKKLTHLKGKFDVVTTACAPVEVEIQMTGEMQIVGGTIEVGPSGAATASIKVAGPAECWSYYKEWTDNVYECDWSGEAPNWKCFPEMYKVYLAGYENQTPCPTYEDVAASRWALAGAALKGAFLPGGVSASMLSQLFGSLKCRSMERTETSWVYSATAHPCQFDSGEPIEDSQDFDGNQQELAQVQNGLGENSEPVYLEFTQLPDLGMVTQALAPYVPDSLPYDLGPTELGLILADSEPGDLPAELEEALGALSPMSSMGELGWSAVRTYGPGAGPNGEPGRFVESMRSVFAKDGSWSISQPISAESSAGGLAAFEDYWRADESGIWRQERNYGEAAYLYPYSNGLALEPLSTSLQSFPAVIGWMAGEIYTPNSTFLDYQVLSSSESSMVVEAAFSTEIDPAVYNDLLLAAPNFPLFQRDLITVEKLGESWYVSSIETRGLSGVPVMRTSFEQYTSLASGVIRPLVMTYEYLDPTGVTQKTEQVQFTSWTDVDGGPQKAATVRPQEGLWRVLL